MSLFFCVYQNPVRCFGDWGIWGQKKALRQTLGLIVLVVGCDLHLLSQASFLQLFAAGYDHVDLEACKRRGVRGWERPSKKNRTYLEWWKQNLREVAKVAVWNHDVFEDRDCRRPMSFHVTQSRWAQVAVANVPGYSTDGVATLETDISDIGSCGLPFCSWQQKSSWIVVQGRTWKLQLYKVQRHW